MFFTSMVKIFNNSINTFYNDNYSKVNPDLIRFFRTEYGSDWKAALEQHRYKENIKNNVFFMF